MARTYDETGEALLQVQVFDDTGLPAGEKILCTESQIEDLEAQLPKGWYIEEYP